MSGKRPTSEETQGRGQVNLFRTRAKQGSLQSQMGGAGRPDTPQLRSNSTSLDQAKCHPSASQLIYVHANILRELSKKRDSGPNAIHGNVCVLMYYFRFFFSISTLKIYQQIGTTWSDNNVIPKSIFANYICLWIWVPSVTKIYSFFSLYVSSQKWCRPTKLYTTNTYAITVLIFSQSNELR